MLLLSVMSTSRLPQIQLIKFYPTCFDITGCHEKIEKNHKVQ